MVLTEASSLSGLSMFSPGSFTWLLNAVADPDQGYQGLSTGQIFNLK